MHFDFSRKDEHAPVSLSPSLSIYICKNSLDLDQTRMEFRKECFVNLKICACDRKYKSRCTPLDVFFFCKLVYTLAHAMHGSRGGSRTPPPPEKSQKYRIFLQYWTGSPEILKATLAGPMRGSRGGGSRPPQ